MFSGEVRGQNVKALGGKLELSDRSQLCSWDAVVDAHFLFSYVGLCSYGGEVVHIVFSWNGTDLRLFIIIDKL